jgi:hypothetical protein
MVAAILPKEARRGSRSAWGNDSRRSLANYREITMIVALLFLILFALLFPRALRFLFALVFIGGIMALGEVHAEPTQCSLTINGKVYINKICNGEFEKDGSFTIGAGQTSRDHYFVYMNQNDDGTMTGYWNGTRGESHAHESLGLLLKSGRCWANAHAQVCAIAGE